MIYFDNSATTRISDGALASYQAVSEQFFGNPSSLHQLGEDASQLLQQSRQQIADLLKVKADEIFFTSGGTEGDNWAIKGTAFEKRKAGKHLITSAIEHPAVRKSFEDLERLGFETTYLSVDESGRVDPADLQAAIRPDTTLVSVMLVNNEVGSLQPIEELGDILEDYPAIHFHVDAVQALGKVELNLDQSRIDLATFSGHKFHGPRGVGFLYKKSGRQLMPLLSGGGQESGERSGTENTPAHVAMAKAVRETLEEDEAKKVRLKEMLALLREHLEDLDHVHIFTPQESAPHILCFGIEGIRGEVLVHALEDKDIYVSTTSACSSRKKVASSTLHAMKVSQKQAESAIRVSLSEYNSMAEMEHFIRVFDDLYQDFSKLFA